jgi:hypothetical protein
MVVFILTCKVNSLRSRLNYPPKERENTTPPSSHRQGYAKQSNALQRHATCFCGEPDCDNCGPMALTRTSGIARRGVTASAKALDCNPRMANRRARRGLASLGEVPPFTFAALLTAFPEGFSPVAIGATRYTHKACVDKFR